MPSNSELPNALNDQLNEMTGGVQDPGDPAQEVSYRVVGEAKIPVSKAHGKLWKQRRDKGVEDLKEVSDAWQEAVNYYSLTQDTNRSVSDGQKSGSNAVRQRNNDILTERENLVFANTAAMVPSLYAKAPDVSVTALAPEYQPVGIISQHLLNTLLYRKASPGVNLKPKVRKGIVQALLMNECWAQIGYTQKSDTNTQAMQDLNKAAEDLQNAKNIKEIKEVEGRLQALESKVSVLLPGGPFVKLRRGSSVLIDAEAVEDDASDAAWIMYYDYLPTTYIQAVYAKKNADGDYASIYKPTHILNSGGTTQSLDDQVNNFRLITRDQKDDRDEAMKKLTDVTKVWYIEDKTTRRIYMYNDEDWSWPIWVWDDPYHLDTFFTLKRLAFHTHPTKTRTKGEVSYYLDQVDAISEINDAEARARQHLKRGVIYDTTIIKDHNTLDKYLRGDDKTAVGVPVPEGKKLEDAVFSQTPDVVKYQPLFDERAIQKRLASIDRISSVSDIQRGAQFKTNTTNKAIDAYTSVSNQRIDDRIDQIEDWIGDIAWAMLQMCLQFMTQEDVAYLIGQQDAAGWTQMQPDQIQKIFSCRIEGGSTIKPTSRAKKQEAMEAGQVVGQFAQAAPGPTLKLMLKMFEKAFDEFEITDQDWKDLDAAIFATQQQGNSTGAQPGGAPSQPGQQPAPGQQQQADPNSNIPPAVQQIISKLPPQVQQQVMQAIQKAVQQGIPPQQAVEEVMKELQQTQGQQTNAA